MSKPNKNINLSTSAKRSDKFEIPPKTNNTPPYARGLVGVTPVRTQDISRLTHGPLGEACRLNMYNYERLHNTSRSGAQMRARLSDDARLTSWTTKCPKKFPEFVQIISRMLADGYDCASVALYSTATQHTLYYASNDPTNNFSSATASNEYNSLLGKLSKDAPGCLLNFVNVNPFFAYCCPNDRSQHCELKLLAFLEASDIKAPIIVRTCCGDCSLVFDQISNPVYKSHLTYSNKFFPSHYLHQRNRRKANHGVRS